MKLSEAIRLGAMKRGQTFGALFDGRGTCAWGAALDAAGILTKLMRLDVNTEEKIRIVRGAFPMIYNIFTHCPTCGDRRSLLDTIMHLNDEHKWTREAIANWVETEEPQPATPQETHEEVLETV